VREIVKRETLKTSIVGSNSTFGAFYCLRVNISLVWSKKLEESGPWVL
jgi:hypothetical protein